MQLTIDQLDLILRIHKEIIDNGELDEIYRGDHINALQDSLADKEENGKISRMELKILQRMNKEIKGE